MGHPEIVLLSIKWVNLRFERIDSRWVSQDLDLKKFKILKLTSPQNLRLVYQVSKIMKISFNGNRFKDFKSGLPETTSYPELVSL